MTKLTSITYKANGHQELSWRLLMFSSLLACPEFKAGILKGQTDLSIFPVLYGLKVTLENSGELVVENAVPPNTIERILCEVQHDLNAVYLSQGRSSVEEALLCAAVQDCITAIVMRTRECQVESSK